MWDDLLGASAKHGFRIRSIWIADAAWQGRSADLNVDRLGNDPSWYDYARDIYHMINQLRADMPRPLVGIGHSFGATCLTHLSLLHPRLLTTLVLMDPVLQYRFVDLSFGYSTLALSAVRRDLWPSREAAAASMGRSDFYQAWDPRVFDLWIEHGLRDTPTPLYPGIPYRDAAGRGQVTLATTKHMEVFTYLRPTRQATDAATGRRVFARARIPDIDDERLAHMGTAALYRPEMPNTAALLPHVRPGILLVLGGQSSMSTPELRKEKLDMAGVGCGGSGGVDAGRVRDVVVEDAGHLVPMEKPTACALHAAAWIESELRTWREEEEELENWWRKSSREKQVLDDEWRGFIEETRKAREAEIAIAKL